MGNDQSLWNEKLWNLIETENLPAVRRRYRHELERRNQGRQETRVDRNAADEGNEDCPIICAFER